MFKLVEMFDKKENIPQLITNHSYCNHIAAVNN